MLQKNIDFINTLYDIPNELDSKDQLKTITSELC